uniref:CCHC-type domain-containing protein n=1 Tax=Tanacetum cinerariifolium TaxID=118510 RepID=A0A6L2KA63_TANCI|nr:hypothetical protein [Tanacetum cinerariifolium]
MMIKGGEIQKSKKKSLKAKGKGKANGKGNDKQVYIPKPKIPKPAAKENPTKDDTCHHCKDVGHWKRNCPIYLDELLKKKSKLALLVLQETIGYYFYFPPKNKIVVARYAELFEKNLITQEVSRRAVDLEKIQDEDTSPSEITSEILIEVEGFEPPQEEVIRIRRSENNMEWVLVDLPLGCKTIRSKWIFKKKTDMDGIVHTYKSRLVAKGYTQLYGVDYEETFSPVTDIRAIRILISIAAYYDYEIWQIWNKRFDQEIKKFGFARNLDEPCVYQKASGSNVTFLILYVDDKIIMGNHIPSLQSVKDYLGKCLAMKDLGKSTFIVGIKNYIDRSKRLIEHCQNAYMDNILKRHKMDNSKRGHIPVQERLDLNKTQGASTPKEVKRMQNVPYASAMSFIMYAVRCTRIDVAFTQNITSRFQQNPGKCHWTAMKSILKYLRNTKDMFLVYEGNLEAELRVDCYCDAGFKTDRDDKKSQTGYVFILNGVVVDWKSSKQSTTAMYAIEAEYIAASEAAMEIV